LDPALQVIWLLLVVAEELQEVLQLPQEVVVEEV
jgi:hypothetical protein